MKYAFVLALLLTGSALVAQDVKPFARAGFYNTENLYDTINDPKVNDEEFLPGGKYKWTSDRYETKINNLAKVILEMNGGNGMDVIGFSETENRNVLNDLTQKTALKNIDYGIVHYDSYDQRGIDVALIYNKAKFTVLASSKVQVKLPSDTLPPTRNILVVQGVLGKKDTLFFFVNHWPSRRSGSAESQSRRMCAADALLHAIDSVRAKSPDARLVVMGDFNDTPGDSSIQYLIDKAALFNLMEQEVKLGSGTHYYKKEVSIFDQLIVSENMIGRKGCRTTPDGGRIYQPDWLMSEVYKGEGLSPFRTFAGSRYLGGYSDHLPVYMDLYLEK